MKRIAGTLAALVLLAGCGGGNAGDEKAVSEPVATPTEQETQQSARQQAVENPSRFLERCEVPSDDLTTAVEDSLPDGEHLDKAQMYLDPIENVIYLSANVMQDDEQQHSAAIWLIMPGEYVYALSSSVQEMSPGLPDGTNLGYSAGSEPAQIAMACTIAAMRVDN